jgi:hypothetical protein
MERGPSFWANRNDIASRTNDLVLVTEVNKSETILGFCIASETTNLSDRKATLIRFIQSFYPGQGIATRLLDYVAKNRPNNGELRSDFRCLLLIDDPLKSAIPFWNRYIEKHPESVGFRSWWLQGYGCDRTSGPVLTLTRDITKGDFVKIIDNLREKFGTQHIEPSKDYVDRIDFTLEKDVDVDSDDDSDGEFYVKTNKFSWRLCLKHPSDLPGDWRTEWKDNDDVLFKKCKNKTTGIVCKKNKLLSNAYFKWMCKAVKEFGIEAHYIL